MLEIEILDFTTPIYKGIYSWNRDSLLIGSKTPLLALPDPEFHGLHFSLTLNEKSELRLIPIHPGTTFFINSLRYTQGRKINVGEEIRFSSLLFKVIKAIPQSTESTLPSLREALKKLEEEEKWAPQKRLFFDLKKVLSQ